MDGALNGYRLRSAHGDTIDPRQPLPVDTVEAQETSSVAPTLTYNGKAAAGAISISSVALKPIIENLGSRVGSYWGQIQNRVYLVYADGNPKKGNEWLTSVTETATAAAITIYDPNKNLEEMFESVTGTVKRFIVKVYDKSGGTLYGWVRGVAASSGVYTFEIMNNRLTETQSWVGTLTSFDNTSLEKVEIYFYNSSIAFGTGTCFTEEVECPKEYSKSRELQLKHAETLSNGQFFVDYMRGDFIGPKADTTASETVTYNVWASTAGGTSGPAANVNVEKVGGTATVTGGVNGLLAVGGNIAHDAVDTGNPLKIGGKAASAKPTAVSAGDRVDAYFDTFGRQHVYDEGGGGVSGGGLSTYVFTPSNSFGHGTSAYGSGTTFTVSGHSFTPEAVALTKVDRFNSAGVFQETLSPSQGTITASTTAGVTTYTYAAGAFSAGDLFVIYQAGPERTVNVPNDAARGSVINPANSFRSSDVVTYTNIATNTATYDYWDIEGMRTIGLGVDTSGTTPTDTLTITLEVSFQNDGTASASCRYYDYTLDFTGASSWVDTDFSVIIDLPVTGKYLRTKKVTSNGGGNDADVTYDFMEIY